MIVKHGPQRVRAVAPEQHDGLIAPHGGVLRNLLVGNEVADDLRAASREWPSLELTPRQLCDLELLLNGAFSPLEGFLGRSDYESVCSSGRLASSLLWPIPVTLDCGDEAIDPIARTGHVALRDPEGALLACLHVGDVWEPDRSAEAEAVFGTLNPEHPGVSYLLNRTRRWYVGGRVEGIHCPVHHDFRWLRRTPGELRAEFLRAGWSRVVAFQTRNPMHRAHFELTRRASEEADAKLLIHPVVGMTKPGDVDHYTRVRSYRAVLQHYPDDSAMLSLLPLAMRMAGPREALWHAIIRKNYGCSLLIVGRDHAGPGSDSEGTPFYGPYEAQQYLQRHEQELGLRMVPFRTMVYVEDHRQFFPEDEVPQGSRVLSLSGTQLRQRLSEGGELPEWFTFPEVVEELRRSFPPLGRQGLTVFFTGLSGAGKSTLANALLVRLLEIGGRDVTLLDGDLVRKHLSSELGFSKEHRDINIRRIGFVASEITRHGGIAICAPIAPYDAVRREVRSMIEPHGGMILVYVSTPLEVCEQRDRKGLYAKARAGLVENFTGISDPYEPPTDAEVTLDASVLSPQEAVEQIIRHLEQAGYLQTQSASCKGSCGCGSSEAGGSP